MTRPKFLVVLPYMLQSYYDECAETMRFHEQGRVMAIDNTVDNRGIMRSHNLAIDERHPDEWLIIMSAALRFGRPGGLDFIDHLHHHDDHGVISCSDTFGWHLVAFRPDVVEKMGRFDENFTPYGWDDIDLSIRIHKLMPDLIWGGWPCDLTDMGMAHSIKLAGLESPATPLLEYFNRKWLVPPGSEFDEYADHPFGNPDHHVNYWPSINGATWDGPLFNIHDEWR